ncbi:hypothetical protein [Gemmatimonas groenlandica]|uniref:Intracellular proteinase inhibitor BsuPI domain-containing protein n=1 Tax=Gemmatimonas groenlandica TaxID=2732249 RepID=A0A6M4ISQ5_9BACT|nr:hypothetical protein [Gemmatimonas groenlandica]QJR37215.1 hypothetical protein HKW67_17675 [Gemmatimonas groenlandica]
MTTIAKLFPLIALGFAACRSATEVSSPLDISLWLSATSAAQPATIDVEVTVVNRDSRVVQTADPRSYACFPPYHVSDAFGRTVELPGRICAAIAFAPIQLAPGARVVIRDRWALDASDRDRGSLPVDAGQYRVRARVFGAEQERVSAPITVTVRR